MIGSTWKSSQRSERWAASWPLSDVLVLGALPTATPCARLHARTVLSEWGLGKTADTVELVVSELVTNAVQASLTADGQPSYEGNGAGLSVVYLRLSSDHVRLIVEVWDQSAGVPTLKQAESDQEEGRGLLLVEALCVRWDWDMPPGWTGKVVWAELRVE